ncbi:MAG: sigma-70 family RNA polymerase sigma factor [Candidatus Thiodiazotropha sp. (ex. Lucinoma kazani)]
MNEISDEELYRRYCRGDTQAFEQVYERYRQSLYLFLLRSCNTRADAEELYQEVWSRIIATAKPFKQGSFKAYIFQIARNLKIDRFRREHLRIVSDEVDMTTVQDPGKTPDGLLHDLDCSEMLKRHLVSLPHEQSEVFLLKEEAGLTLEQIATMISVGRETVKSRLRYALRQLRKLMEECL